MNMLTNEQVLLTRLEAEVLFSKLDRMERMMSELFSQKTAAAAPRFDKPLTAAEAREYLSKGKTSFSQLVSSGALPFTLSGKSKRFSRAHLDAYLNRNQGKGINALLPDAKPSKKKIV